MHYIINVYHLYMFCFIFLYYKIKLNIKIFTQETTNNPLAIPSKNKNQQVRFNALMTNKLKWVE